MSQARRNQGGWSGSGSPSRVSGGHCPSLPGQCHRLPGAEQLSPRGWVPQSAQLHRVQLLTSSSATPAWVQGHRPSATQGLGLLPLRHTSTLHSGPQKAGKFEQVLLGFLLQGFLLGEAAATVALSSVALGAISGSSQKPPVLQREAQDCSVPSICNPHKLLQGKGSSWRWGK